MVRPTKRRRVHVFKAGDGEVTGINDDALEGAVDGPGTVDENAKDGIWTSYLMMMNYIPRPVKWLASLRLLEVTSKIYESRPMTTVASRVVEQVLVEAKWQPSAIADMRITLLDDERSRRQSSNPITLGSHHANAWRKVEKLILAVNVDEVEGVNLPIRWTIARKLDRIWPIPLNSQNIEISDPFPIILDGHN